MTALEDAYWLDRRKHMLSANRAVAVEGVFEANVVVKDRQVDTAAALSAVLIVDAKPFPHAAQATVFAMKNGLVGVREEVANVAVILR